MNKLATARGVPARKTKEWLAIVGGRDDDLDASARIGRGRQRSAAASSSRVMGGGRCGAKRGKKRGATCGGSDRATFSTLSRHSFNTVRRECQVARYFATLAARLPAKSARWQRSYPSSKEYSMEL